MKYAVYIAVLVCVSQAQADWYWAPDTETTGHHGHGPKRYVLNNTSPDQPPKIELIHSDLVHSALPLSDGKLVVRPTGKNNYHLLIATAKRPTDERVAARYLYFNGRPVATSPSDLLAEPHATLALIPDPLPREHWRYESQKKYQYRVMFKGKAVPNQPVLATTSFGSTQILHSNESGILDVFIPDDFPEEQIHARATAPAELRLFTSVKADGTTYQYSLSSPYYVNHNHWKKTTMGVFVLGMGCVAGLVINRRVPHQERRKDKRVVS